MKDRLKNNALIYVPLPWTLFGLIAAEAVVALLVRYTGGEDSPWTGLFFLAISAAGFISLVAAVIASVSAAVLLLATIVLFDPSPFSLQRWGIFTLLFLGTAIVTGVLARRLRCRQRSLDREAESARHALDVQHMINAAYDIEVTLDMVLLKQRELTRADACAVLLNENNRLRVRAASGIPESGRSFWLSPGEDDHGWSPLDGRPLLVADTRNSHSCLKALMPDACSILAVPMQSVERLVGLLLFGSREPDAFSTSTVKAVEEFATATVFPVQRAILEDELRRLAFTDAQTSLFNHRHFQTQLDEEIRRAQRYGRDLSLILLDIDDFKQLNDRFGHPAGDHLLKEIAGVLRASLRTVDIPARYGGEEFAIVCPETGAESATILAERLRRQVAEADLIRDNNQACPVTVSVGVAAYPAHAGNKAELIDAADQALYAAKRSGKNRVLVFES